ncbi:MAG: THUMP domain-containing protein [Candidatus Woesearchaeota archaeon]
MDYTHLLLRYGEIFLKGQNKGFFEKRLLENIRKIAGISKIKNIRGRLIAAYVPDHLKLKQVFGLVSYSPAIKIETDFEKIKQSAVELLKDKKGTFKIEPKRSDKRFPVTSPEINIQLGHYIEENTSLRFSGENYDHLLGVEINQDGAYLFTEVIGCFGGLPTGVEGRVGVLIEDEASLLAALLFMKRGCDIYPLSTKENKIELLQKFSPVKIELNIFKTLKEIEEFCIKNKLDVIVSGQNLEKFKEYNLSLTVLHPLVAYSEEEIKEELDTYRAV